MSHGTFKSFVSAAFLLGTMALAPAANAQDRNTGVGHEIAAQGNQAIQLIRAEFKAAAKLLKPSLKKVRVTKVSAPSFKGDGATFVATTTVRCAE
jgi:hypothetical protein